MHKHLPATELALERVSGAGRIAVEARHGKTVLTSLFQDGAAKIRLPSQRSAGLEAVLINTAGGVTGGDRLAWSAKAGPQTHLTLTTPAAEKAYRANSGEARIEISLEAGAGASLFWLPQETILFEGSSLRRRINAGIAADATLLIAECIVFGRTEMGEALQQARYRDSWRISRGGKLLQAEEFSLGPDAARQLGRPALFDGAGAMASLIYVSPQAADLLDPLRALLGDRAGASTWDGRILARMLARDGFELRQRLVPVLKLLNGQAELPKLWSI